MAIRRTSHAVYDTRYHLVWAPKYRKWVLKGDLREFVKQCFQEIAVVNDFEIEAMEIAEDHESQKHAHSSPKTNKGLDNPIIGGIVVSMSNPYLWVWWATIGFAFMIQFNVSFKEWSRLLAFFVGHEAGDLAWYLFVSILSFFGLRYFNKKVYCGILVCCGIFMILFGLYMGISPFLYLGRS
jgi:hypothetical protein